MLVDFGEACAEERAQEEFPTFHFGLDCDEGEVGFGVHVACKLFDEGDLSFDGSCAAFY